MCFDGSVHIILLDCVLSDSVDCIGAKKGHFWKSILLNCQMIVFYLKTLVMHPKGEAFSLREQGNFTIDKIKMMACRMVNE
jgi:hypothetical protein